MSPPTRNISNPPDYYFNLTTKQQRSWRQHTRKIERNEKSRSQYPTYCPASNVNVIHLHHRTEITTIDQLIQHAKATKRFTVDTESQRGRHENNGALVQLEMVHSINYSTVILMEMYHLPDMDSILFERFKELWLIIFNSGNEIITWGLLAKEFKDFQHLEWMKIGNIKKGINLQFLFQEWYNKTVAHPATERRVGTTGVSMGTPVDDNYSDEEEFIPNYNESTTVWSLQSAVATVLRQFIDKLETVNDWNCGLDLELGTWRSKLFSRKYYDMQVEKQQRRKMINYAVHDCTSVTELYFKMYPNEANISNINSNETPQTTSTTNHDIDDNVSDISETPISIQQFKSTSNEEPTELTVKITEEEIEEFKEYETSQSIQQKRPQEEATTTRKVSKSEHQRRKNKKLKQKQKHHPAFQRKIKRPIYHRYDYRKIRAQLLDDQIFTSHQITINRQHNEVIIGFKSKEEQEHATKIMKINYFSKTQYYDRWG